MGDIANPLNTKVDKYTFVAELEQAKLELSQSVKGLDQNLKEQGATFRAQVGTELQGAGSNVSDHRLVQNFMEQGATFRAQVGTELHGAGSNIQSTCRYRTLRSREKHSGHRLVQSFKNQGVTFRAQIAQVGTETEGAGVSNIQGTGVYRTSRSWEQHSGSKWVQNFMEQQHSGHMWV